jgi:hypothetical protein
VKHQIALCAAAMILGLAASDKVLAQAMAPPPYPPAYPGGGYPPPAGALPPYEIMTIVRSTGFEPLSRPLRQGPAYVVRAADGAGRLMHVYVDARMGRIVRVVPAMRRDAMAPYPPPPPYPIPPGRVVPDGNSSNPNSRIAGLPDGAEDIAPDERGAPPARLPGAMPAPARTAPKAANTSAGTAASAPAGPPPLPRARPKMAAVVAEPAPSAPAAPMPSIADAAPSVPTQSAPAPGASAAAAAPAPSASTDPPLVELDE